MTYLRFLSFTIIMLWIYACNDKKLDTKKVAAQLHDRKIRRISEGEISNIANASGDSIVHKLEKIWYERIENSLEHEDYSEAVKNCAVENYTLKDSLEKIYAAEIKRVGVALINRKHTPDALEAKLIDAYQYNLENKMIVKSNIQAVNADYILYTSPITIKDKMCLTCHGVQEKELKEAHRLIEKSYPDMKPASLKMGDLIGIWSVMLSRKEIVRSIK